MPDDFGYALRSGSGKGFRYWYRNPTTGRLYEGPKPRPALVREHPTQPHHPGEAETEPCPWEGLGGGHEQVVIPGPPEVLYNKQGLTSPEDIHPLESLGTMRAIRYLQEQVTPTTPMTAAWLRRLHKMAFGEIYTWAGEYRTVRISKGGRYPFDGWCYPQHIATSMIDLEQKFLRQLTPVGRGQADDVPRRAAILISEFLLIHPFREGNGRIAQMMGNWVAWQADLPAIAYGIDEDSDKKDAYILALQQGYNQNYAPLEQFVQEGLDRSTKALRRLKLEHPLPEGSDTARG